MISGLVGRRLFCVYCHLGQEDVVWAVEYVIAEVIGVSPSPLLGIVISSIPKLNTTLLSKCLIPFPRNVSLTLDIIKFLLYSMLLHWLHCAMCHHLLAVVTVFW